MHAFKTAALAVSLFAVTGCSTFDKTAICCDGGYEYRHRNQWEAEKASSAMAARVTALENDRQRLSNDLASAQKQNASLNSQVTHLERQLADRDLEVAALRSGAGASAALASQLSSAQADLSQAQLRSADLESQLAAARAEASGLHALSGDSDKLASDLAAANQRAASLEAQLAGLQGMSGDKDKLAADLVAARQRMGELEAQLATMGTAAAEQDKLAAELAALKQRSAELERQLAERDKELAGLRGDLSSEMAKLKDAQRSLIKALRPQIEKGTIMVDLNNERLLINLASGYLFGSGEDELKPAGVDALRQVGGILKDFPEYKVAVDGHTDNRPIRSGLKKKFPTNKELSDARAANAAKALTEGGLGGAEIHGYADSRPVMPNTTDAGRAKNRRVEVRVTR